MNAQLPAKNSTPSVPKRLSSLDVMACSAQSKLRTVKFFSPLQSAQVVLPWNRLVCRARFHVHEQQDFKNVSSTWKCTFLPAGAKRTDGSVCNRHRMEGSSPSKDLSDDEVLPLGSCLPLSTDSVRVSFENPLWPPQYSSGTRNPTFRWRYSDYDSWKQKCTSPHLWPSIRSMLVDIENVYDL